MAGAMDDLVLALLAAPHNVSAPAVAAKARDLTISWSRFKYSRDILEADSVDALLREAASTPHRYCLVQSPGHILHEVWTPENRGSRDFMELLSSWMRAHDFLVLGHLVPGADGAEGLDPRCLVVDLKRYRELGQPAFDGPA